MVHVCQQFSVFPSIVKWVITKFLHFQIHDDYVHGCRICNPGDMRHTASPNTDDINVITEEEEEEDPASLRYFLCLF